jgi:arylformamidase
MRRFIDLTHLLDGSSLAWPGDPTPEFSEKASVEKNGYSVHTMKLNNHTGTHLDAPSHVIRGGMTLDRIPLEMLIGRAVVLDFTDKGTKDCINRQDLESFADRLEAGGRVLVKTGWDRYFNTPAFYQDFPCFTLEAARYLVSKGIILLGMDMPSPSPADDPDQAIHKTFLGAGVVLLEALKNLTLIHGQECDIIALPPLFKGLSGSPCRVVAIEQA